jgi:hypothetical protein
LRTLSGGTGGARADFVCDTIAGCHARLVCAQHGRVANGVTRRGRESGWTEKSPVKEPRTWKHGKSNHQLKPTPEGMLSRYLARWQTTVQDKPTGGRKARQNSRADEQEPDRAERSETASPPGLPGGRARGRPAMPTRWEELAQHSEVLRFSRGGKCGGCARKQRVLTWGMGAQRT